MIAPDPNRGQPEGNRDDHDSRLLPNERVRQVHAVCLLLDAEANSSVKKSQVVERDPVWERPRSFTLAVIASTVLVVASVVFIVRALTAPSVHAITDYRLGSNYSSDNASDAVLTQNGRQLLLGTQGGGLHTIDAKTRYLRRYTNSSTAGGLLSDDVRSIDHDDQGRLYFLCRQQDRLGLCRANDELKQWTTLIGIEQFAALNVPDPLEEISAAALIGGELWIGTKSSGIGRYSLQKHAWREVAASPQGLLDNRIRDIVADTAGNLWIATAEGINRFDHRLTKWDRFGENEGLTGRDIARLRWLDGTLWYATAAGGLGRFQNGAWGTLIPESGWNKNEGSELAAVVPDSEARLWFATVSGSVGRYDPQRRSWFDVGQSPATGNVRALAVPFDRDVTAWLATEKELLRFVETEDKANGQWQQAFLGAVDRLDARQGAVVTRLSPTANQPFPALRISSDGIDWRDAVGGHGVRNGSASVHAADYDIAQQQLWVGTERGISRYDAQVNDWSDEFPLPPGDRATLVDLRLQDHVPLVLTSKREVSRLQLQGAKWDHLLGGGAIDAPESEITAVTRDAAGQLWIGTQAQGLFSYDPQLHRWASRIPFAKPIDDLQASAGTLWLTSGGMVHVMVAGRALKPLSDKLPTVASLTAAPHVPGAVLLCRNGQVFLADDNQQIRTLVGSAAPGWDLTSAPTVGLLGEAVVCGGDEPHVYRTTTRSWQALPIGPVAEIVPAMDALWLRTNKGLVRIAADLQPEVIPKSDDIVKLAGTSDRLAVLSKDGAIRVRTRGAADWVAVKEPVRGPVANLMSGDNWSATCVGDGLYLSGGKEGEVWHFGWDTQQWHPVAADSKPLKGVRQLMADGDDVFALNQSGNLYSGRAGKMEMSAAVRDVATARDGGGTVAMTSKAGVASIHAPGGWQTVVGNSLRQSIGELRLSVAAADGIVLAGTEGTAWLSSGLNEWRSINTPGAGRFAVDEYRSSQDGKELWALTTQKRLFVLDKAKWTWKSVLPDGQAVESITVTTSADDRSELWVCLSDGAVYRVQGDQSLLWSRPSAAPGKPTEIVGISPVPGGFLAAFAPGKLALFDGVKRTWSEVPSPTPQRLVDLVTLGSFPDGCSLLRTEDGTIYRSPLKTTPEWTSVATSASSLCRNGQTAWVVAGKQRQLLRLSAKEPPTELQLANGRIDVSWGPLTAACELPLGAGNPGLALGFASQLAIYDAVKHHWLTQAIPVHGLSPIANGVLVLDARGSVSLAKIPADKMTLEGLAKSVVAAGSALGSQNWVAVQEDGQVSLFEGANVKKPLLGRAWSGNATQGRIQNFAALGPWFLVLDDAGSLHSYNRLTRDWQKVTGVTGCRRMAGGEGGVWVEVATAKAAQLMRVTVDNDVFTAKKVVDDLVRWTPGPAGVLVVAQNNGKRIESFLRETGQTDSVSLAVAPGPDDRAIVGSKLFNNCIWLKSSAGTLWNYRPASRHWHELPLDPQSAVESTRFAADRVWVKEANGGLWVGQPDPTHESGWRFAETMRGIKSFDVDEILAVTTTGTQISVLDTKATVRAVRDFSTRAWAGNNSRPVLAAGRGESLMIVSQEGSAAIYELSARKWTTLQAVPGAAVDLTAMSNDWFVIGSKDDLHRLQGTQWEPVQIRSEKDWQAGQNRYVIDNRGRLLANPEPGKADSPVPAQATAVTATPVRIHADRNWLLIELSDGSLWRYAGDDQELLRSVSAVQSGRRIGLVTTAKGVYFVAQDARRVWSIAEETGKLIEVKLPDDLANQNWTVLVHSQGLLIGDQTGVLLTEGLEPIVLDSAALTEHKLRSKAPLEKRHLQAGRWRLATATEQTAVRLECQFKGEWKNVTTDFGLGRLGWDSAITGLSAGDQIILATTVGIVIRQADSRNLPSQLLPIDWSGGLKPGGRVWALSDKQFLVRAHDGRKWMLNLGNDVTELQSLPTLPTQWTITRGPQSLEFKADFGGKLLPVAIDRTGIFNCDVPTSVAVAENAVWVGTGAGLFEYSADLTQLRDAFSFGSCDVGAAMADRRQLVVQQGDGKLVARDAGKWKAYTATWARLQAQWALSDHQPGSPLEWEIDLGREQPAVRKVRYVGRGLSTDVIIGEKGQSTEACDGKRLFALTPDGLVERHLTGEWIGMHSLTAAEGLTWTRNTDGEWKLVIQGAKGTGWILRQSSAEAIANVAAIQAQHSIEWNGRLLQGELVNNQRLTLRVTEGPAVEILDLKERGFIRDRVLTAEWDGTAAWIVSPVAIERHVGTGDEPPQIFTNPFSARVPHFVRDGRRLWLTDDDLTLELTDAGAVMKVSPTAAEKPVPVTLWRSPSWRVTRPADATGQSATIEFRTNNGEWIKGSLDGTHGLSWDQLVLAGIDHDELVLATKAGDFAIPYNGNGASLPLSDWQPASRPADAARSNAAPLEFWSDASGKLWHRVDTQWLRYRSGGANWERIGDLPADQKSERAILAQTPHAAWTRTDAAVQYVEFDATGQAVRSTLSADGVLANAFVRTALPHGDFLWLLTRQDLRQVDAKTGVLIKSTANQSADVTKAEFRADGPDWYLRWRRGMADEVYRLGNAGWESAGNQLGPFGSQLTRTLLGPIRLQTTAQGLDVQVRESESRPEWHTVKFSPTSNRFEFQVALDCVSNGNVTLVATPAGVAAWKLEKNAWNLVSFRPDLKSVSTPAASRRLLAWTERETVEEFGDTGSWQVTTLADTEKSVVAKSKRWLVSRDPTGQGQIAVQSQGDKLPATTLPLDPKGDFEFRYPRSLVTTKDGSLWMASHSTLTRFEIGPRVTKTPTGVWVDNTAAKPVTDLFVVDEQVHASFGATLFRYDASKWLPVTDREGVELKRRQIADGEFWTWGRAGNGKLTGTLKVSGQPALSPTWDVVAGRFNLDLVKSGAKTSDALWLCDSMGLTQLSPATGQVVGHLDAANPPRLALDRGSMRWLVERPESPDKYALLKLDPATGKLASIGDLSPVIAGPSDRYLDADWRFGANGMFWKSRQTRIIDRHFAQDHFQSMALLSTHVVIATPIGMIVWRTDGSKWEFAKIISPPILDEELMIEASEPETLRAIGRKSRRVFECLLATGDWQPVPAGESARTLIDSPRWKWSQSVDGEVQLAMKSADQPSVKPILNSDGRFAWDDVAAVVCDDGDVWVAGRDGIVLRSLEDGEPRRWYRTGIENGQRRPLGSIVRLGRFNEDGTSVMSWAATETVAAASLLALGEDGSVWRFEGVDDAAVWVRSNSDPWSTSDGLRSVRHSLLESIQTPDGQTVVRYAQSPDVTPVLSEGRLTIDSVRDIALAEDNDLMLATRAGIVRAASDTAAFRQLWSGTSTDNELVDARQIYRDGNRLRSRSGANGDVLNEFDPGSGRWSRVDSVDQNAELGDALVQSEQWTWSRVNDHIRIRLHRAGPISEPWALFLEGRFSFDVLRDCRLSASQLVVATPGGVARIDADSMDVRQIDRTAIDADTGQRVPLLSVERFAGDGSLTCFDDGYIYRHDGKDWIRTVGKERLGEHRFASASGHWQVQPVMEGTTGGFDVLQHNRQGLLIAQRRVLPGILESQLKRVVASDNGLWLCLVNGVYFIDSKH